MYSIGCFLVAASSWCLLKAVYAPSRQRLWWTAYAFLAAAALHTHNFSLFMIAAQFFYVALVGCRLLPSQLAIDRRQTLHHAAMAFCLVTLLYAPWVPTFLQQAARVHQNFWLPEISTNLLTGTFVTWLTGLRGGDATWFAAIWVVFFLVMIAYTISRRDELGLFFLLQALIPWLATLLVSTLGGRALLDERYLVFSQIALLTYWAYTCAQLPTAAIGLLAYLNLLIPTAAATQGWVASIPSHSPSITEAIQFVQNAYTPGDLILAAEARDLNIFRYYADEAKWSDFDIRCPPLEYGGGHVNHISSLSPNDWLSAGGARIDVRRVWTLNRPHWRLPGQWTETWSEFYEPMDRTWTEGVQVKRYELGTIK
jgi:hypothetical protein